MIEAVIFDMDGVLVDSEPVWRVVEQRVFRTIGIELSAEMCGATSGLDTLSTVAYWHAKRPWDTKPIARVAEEIENEVCTLLSQRDLRNEASRYIVEYFAGKKIPIALASSSPMRIILMVLEKLRLRDKFLAVCSTEFEQYGKPHPAVYLKAAALLSKPPGRCVVFEDTVNGAIAAKAAGMKVVAVPNEEDYKTSRLDFADLKIRSLVDFTDSQFEMINGET